MFCPAYKDGNCPFGRWTARQFFSVTNWTDQNLIEYDYGEAVVNPDSNGNKIVDVVGGQGAAWNWPRNQFFTAFGYPTRSVFSAAAGNRLFVCTSQYATDLDFGSGLPTMMGIGCDMTVYWGGSDGGSWYMDWDATNGGHVNGHNDFKPSNQPEAMYSPYYGDDWHNLVFDPAQHA